MGSPVPSRHDLSVPWMGFEPMLSTVRAWRPLRAGPPGHRSVAQGGVEPPASLLLEEGGLPVAYRAKSSAALSKSRRSPTRFSRQSARRESNPPVRSGRPTPGPLGHGHFVQRKERESNPQGSSLVRVQAGCRRQSACPSVSVWMAGFEPAWSGVRGRRMKPGSPTSRASFAPSPRPTKKARGRVTPGLESRRPVGSGVTAVGGTR